MQPNIRRIYDCFFKTLPIWLQSWSKKRKIGQQNFFLLNVCWFCREKNSKNSGRDGQKFGHFVRPVTKDLRDTGTQVFYPSKTPNNKIKKASLTRTALYLIFLCFQKNILLFNKKNLFYLISKIFEYNFFQLYSIYIYEKISDWNMFTSDWKCSPSLCVSQTLPVLLVVLVWAWHQYHQH